MGISVAGGLTNQPGKMIFSKTPTYAFHVSADIADANLYDLAVANTAWDGNTSAKIIMTIDAGVGVTSTNTTSPALLVPKMGEGIQVVINNNGTIAGKGGNGGKGGQGGQGGSAGSNGGTALKLQQAITLINTGIIAGGGGGGGGGAGNRRPTGGSYGNGGGGGGGASYGTGGIGPSNADGDAGDGQDGTLTDGGNGGGPVGVSYPGGTGGKGGNLGMDGEKGGDGVNYQSNYIGGSGGLAGSSIDGAALANLTDTGTILPALV